MSGVCTGYIKLFNIYIISFLLKIQNELLSLFKCQPCLWVGCDESCDVITCNSSVSHFWYNMFNNVSVAMATITHLQYVWIYLGSYYQLLERDEMVTILCFVCISVEISTWWVWPFSIRSLIFWIF